MAANRSLLDEGDFSSIGAKKGGKSSKKDGEGGGKPSANTIKIVVVGVAFVLAAVIYAWNFGWLDFGTKRRAAAPPPTPEQVEQQAKQQKYNEDMLKSGQATEAGS